MEYKYTINDIKDEVNVSLQSLYTLIKKNKAFIDNNSIRKQRKIYYNQSVMDFFVSYYQPEKAPQQENPNPAEGLPAEGKPENPPSETSHEEDRQQDLIDALKAQIKALNDEVEGLRKQLDNKEEERKELIRQNGALILTLQQEKQEKMLLLPAPKKTFGEKVKSLFKGKAQE